MKLCASAIAVGLFSLNAYAQEKLYVYTSIKDSLSNELKKGFAQKHPEVKLDFQVAGAGKIMAKLAAERESGKVLADVLWTSEMPDFYQLKSRGQLQPYIPAEIKSLIQPLPDYDGSFTAVRLGTLGIVYNTRKIKEPPQSWDDLKKPEYKDAYGIANPALSGTAYVSIALLAQSFGWEYFEALHANGAKMGKGSGQVIDDTASGDLVAALGVDYIALDKIDKGATLGLAFPKEMLVLPSPIAIMKGTVNENAAKKFIDFVLSKEWQQIIANEGTIPVRSDVQIPERFKLPSAEEATKRAIKIDYSKIMSEKEPVIKKFTDIMQKK